MPAGRMYVFDNVDKKVVGEEVPTMKAAQKVIVSNCPPGVKREYLILSVRESIVHEAPKAKEEPAHFK